MNHQRVAITGLGLLCSSGLDTETAWSNLVAGANTARRFSLFDPAGLTTTFGLELPGGATELFERGIMTRSRQQMTRATMMAVVTARMALAHARINPASVDPHRIGAVIGATGTGYAPATLQTDEHRILRNMANAPASWIGLKEKIMGPVSTVSTACSSGAYALHSAFTLIATGECDIVVAGASDSSINFLDVNGFCSLRALSERNDDPPSASRPFDRRRDGFVMGEGCGMLVVESLDHARARGAAIVATMPLPGLSSEGYNILSPQPGGAGMAVAMKKALENAGMQGPEIGYLNAHGTSTPLNDRLEAQAIRDTFGECAATLPVSSTKSMTGHCLSAAAAVEAVICCKALQEGIIPPTLNLTDPDEECALNHVAGTFRRVPLRSVMSNSFGFGGHNGVCIFSRHE